jgi:hypothetical protein
MLVRNPFARVQSYYRWLRQQSFEHRAVTLAKSTDFAGFMADPQTQASFRDWPYGRYMQNAAGKECCDLFIRLEHFAQDAQPLFAHLGFDLILPHENQSGPLGQDQTNYPPEVKKIITDICAEDIERFSYEFPF